MVEGAVVFHQFIEADSLPPKGKVFRIEANEEQRAYLARRFDLVALEALDAEVTLRPLPKGETIALEGHFSAEIVQKCVISLQPFASSVKGSVTRRFGSVPSLDEDVEILIEMDEEEPPEPLDDGKIDICEAVAEEFGLNLDPFPRSPDVEFEGYEAGNNKEEAENDGPFAALAALKDKMKE